VRPPRGQTDCAASGRASRSSAAGPTRRRPASCPSSARCSPTPRSSPRACWPPRASSPSRYSTAPAPPSPCAPIFSSSRKGLADERDRGGRYRVVLPTAGGLYRYQLRDEVEVVGFHHQCPLLRFAGKYDGTSDLVGEKLAEPHVRAVLDRLLAARGSQPCFALLVPILARPARY